MTARPSVNVRKAPTAPPPKPRRSAARRQRQINRQPERRGCLGTLGAALSFALGTLLVATIVGGAAVGAVFVTGSAGRIADYLFPELPSVEKAVEGQVFKSAMIYDRDGNLLYELFDPQGGRRTIVPLREMPTYLVDATLATEDPRFYENPGFDAAAIVRALMQNLRGQAILSGASTITQQLVRNSLIDPAERYDRSYSRKIKEVVLAYQLSQRYTKDEILERYLNEINYGNLAYGVEAAAQTYFGKHVGELTVGEAALLAGLPQSPATNDPLTHPQQAKARQIEVLGLMVRHGYLPAEAAEAAGREELRVRAPRTELRAPHFTMYVRGLLESRYSRQQLYYSGLRVYTTLDPKLQSLAERIARERVALLRDNGVRNAALTAIDPRTGEILAMLGSVDYWDDAISGQVNIALAERQPSSVVKPFTYLTAFAQGKASPGTVLSDEPTTFSGGRGAPAYQPQNPDGKFRGPVTARRALATSLNVPTVRLLQQLGVPALLETLHQMGITSLNSPADYYGLALALGSGEVRLLDLTYAYSVLANGGLQVGEPVPASERQPGRREFRPVAIRKIVDDSGRVLEEYRPSGKRVVSEQAAWLLTDILADNQTRAEAVGQDSPLQLSRPAAAMAGITERRDDSWTIGYTPDLAVGVWVGNGDNRPMRDVTALTGAGAIWHAFMEEALRGSPALPFARPAGVVQATVDARTGLRPGPGAPTITDWFAEENVPKQWNVPTPTATFVPTRTPTPSPTPTATPAASPTAAQPTPPPETAAEPQVPPGMVRVPDLVGMSEAAARQRIESLGLVNASTNYQTPDDVFDKEAFKKLPIGTVVSHTPPAGSVVEKGTTVHIAVRKQ